MSRIPLVFGPIANLTTAIAKDGHLPPLLDALTDRQVRREALADAMQHEGCARRVEDQPAGPRPPHPRTAGDVGARS
jgi:hypothetical protein